MPEPEINSAVSALQRNADRLERHARSVAGTDDALATVLAILRLEEIQAAVMLVDARDGDLGGRTWKQFRHALKNHAHKWSDYKFHMMNTVEGMSEDDRRKLLSEGAAQDGGFKNYALYATAQKQPDGTERWVSPDELDFIGQPEYVLALGDQWRDRLVARWIFNQPHRPEA